MNPSWRKAVGILAILLLIAGWSVAVATLAEPVLRQPWPLVALFFLVSGTVWVLPLKPLLRWMEGGRRN